MRRSLRRNTGVWAGAGGPFHMPHVLRLFSAWFTFVKRTCTCLPSPSRHANRARQVLDAGFATTRRRAAPSDCATDGQQVSSGQEGGWLAVKESEGLQIVGRVPGAFGPLAIQAGSYHKTVLHTYPPPITVVPSSCAIHAEVGNSVLPF